MSANPEPVSRFSLLFRALILTLVMASISGRWEATPLKSGSRWRSLPASETAQQLSPHGNSRTNFLTRSLLPFDRD